MRLKLIFALILASVASAFAQTPLETAVVDNSQGLPKAVANGLVLESISISPDKSAIVLDMTVDGTKVSFPTLKEQASLLKDSKAMEIATASDPKVVALRNACVAGNVDMIYKYTCDGDSFQFTLTPAEIQ